MPSLGSTRRQEIHVERQRSRRQDPHPAADRRRWSQGKYWSTRSARSTSTNCSAARRCRPIPNCCAQMIEGTTIMVTGAGGSIGSELCRHDRAAGARSGWCCSRPTSSRSTRSSANWPRRATSTIVPVLGSVTDDRAGAPHAMRDHGVEVVFHAAAHKHVPLVEANALEGIRNNVFGTQTRGRRSPSTTGVADFVLISTDKAVRPDQRHGRHQALGRADRPAEVGDGRAGEQRPALLPPCASAMCSARTARWCRCSRSRSPLAGR